MLLTLLLTLATPLRADSGAVAHTFQIESFRTHSRLVFRLDEGVGAEKVKNSREGFEILLKGVGLGDLGAPLGEEATWKAQFRTTGDPRVTDVRFDEVTDGVRVRGRWVYPKGGDAPAQPVMEWFDYREKQPPRYVIDLWVKKGPTVAEARTARKRAEHASALHQAEHQARDRAERKLAEAKKRAEVEDVSRFCREKLATETDVFLPLLPVHEKVDFSKYFTATTPDSRFPYYEPKTPARDAQYVRLALNLYRQGKPALVIRALDFYESEHPGSDFRHEMRFLRANALIKLGLQDDAVRILQRLMIDAKATPEALFSGMYLAGKLVEKGDHLAALENFLWLIQHYPEHRLNWVFHLGAAETLFDLKQTERAAKEYEWVIETAQERSVKAEAALRIGDIYADRFRHDQSLGSYARALTAFPEEAKTFPAIHINRAEALYGLEDYPRARAAFLEFLEKYPAHPAGWRATFRLGEIFGREDHARESSRKWFYETVNRYPFSPGATLARLRLVPCDDHGGFAFEGAERFFDLEAAKFDGRGEVSLGLYKELRGLAHVRSLISFNREPQAVTVAIRELQATRRPEARHILGNLLGILYRKTILGLLDEGKSVEALAFYHEKTMLIPRDEQPAEADYILKLSQAAADLGLGREAASLADAYQTMVTRLGRRAPAAPDLEGELQASEQRFTAAKALWVAAGMKEEAAIRERLANVREESRFSYERELILSLMDERSGKVASALTHAIRAQVLRPGTPGPERDSRLEAYVASLEALAGDGSAAIELYRQVEKHLRLQLSMKAKVAPDASSFLGVPPSPSLDEAILAQAGIMETQGRWGDAAATYSRAVEEKIGGSRAVYSYARALLRTKEPVARESAWKALRGLASAPAPSGDDFWRNLAKEALNDEKTANPAKEGLR